MKIIYAKSISERIQKAIKETPPWKQVEKVLLTSKEWKELLNDPIWQLGPQFGEVRVTDFKICGVLVEEEKPSAKDRLLDEYEATRERTIALVGWPPETKTSVLDAVHALRFEMRGYASVPLAALLDRAMQFIKDNT